ncbi:hypothetical protein Tco_1067598 [Tanacetum coccineum]|uniref:Reverse transcriptase domain-containing protein n=1 Tax=Tanacetum coccineum TaxID=301880 RepID=A0ABQ5HDB7_9ASTR
MTAYQELASPGTSSLARTSCTDKLPVIITKDLKDEDKTALLKVPRSHKRAIAWKMSDIKGIDPKFYTHKILMEDNVKPTVQHQKRWYNRVRIMKKTRSPRVMSSIGKDKKDKKKQNQSKTDKKREKTKSRVKNKRNQSRISPIQQGRKSKAKIIKPRTNSDKCAKFQRLIWSFEVQGPKLHKVESCL